MATAKETEKKNITGLDNATNRKDAELDLVSALLEAASYREADDNIVEAEIKRKGKVLFCVNVHPIGETETRLARKRATTMMPHPDNKKLPQIEKEFNNAKFKSWVIYLATTEEDQAKIWGNTTVMGKFQLHEPWESIDVLLTVGEKNKLFELVTKISGLDDDEDVVDQETFQQSAD